MTSLIEEISSNIIDGIVWRKNYSLHPRMVESKEQTHLFFLHVTYDFFFTTLRSVDLLWRCGFNVHGSNFQLAVTFVALFAIEQTYCQENFEGKKGNQNSFFPDWRNAKRKRKRSEKDFINCFQSQWISILCWKRQMIPHKPKQNKAINKQSFYFFHSAVVRHGLINRMHATKDNPQSTIYNPKEIDTERVLEIYVVCKRSNSSIIIIHQFIQSTFCLIVAFVAIIEFDVRFPFLSPNNVCSNFIWFWIAYISLICSFHKKWHWISLRLFFNFGLSTWNRQQKMGYSWLISLSNFNSCRFQTSDSSKVDSKHTWYGLQMCVRSWGVKTLFTTTTHSNIYLIISKSQQQQKVFMNQNHWIKYTMTLIPFQK